MVVSRQQHMHELLLQLTLPCTSHLPHLTGGSAHNGRPGQRCLLCGAKGKCWLCSAVIHVIFTIPTSAAHDTWLCVLLQAQHIETRKLYAVKVFATFEREKRDQLLHEIVMLYGIDCPRYGCCFALEINVLTL